MINILQIIVFLSPKFQKTNIGLLSSLLTFIVYKYLPLINLTIALTSTFKCNFKWINCFLQQMPFYTQVLIALINFFRVKYPLLNVNIYYLGIISFICEKIINPIIFNNNNYSCGLASMIAIIMIILDLITIKTLFLSKRSVSNGLAKQKVLPILMLILDVFYLTSNKSLSCVQIITIVYQNILILIFMNLLDYFVSNLYLIFYLIPFIINLLLNHMHKQIYLKILKQNNLLLL